MSREAEDDFYDITKPIEFKSKDVDDGFQHFWLPMIFMAMPGKYFSAFSYDLYGPSDKSCDFYHMDHAIR